MHRAAFFPLALSLFAPLLFAADRSLSVGVPDHVTAAGIIHEMNLARQNPALYATFVEEMRRNYSGGICLLPGNIHLRTREGVHALDDAIHFLHRAKPQPPLALSPGLCLAAVIIVASRLAVQWDITAAMAAILEIESVAMAW